MEFDIVRAWKDAKYRQSLTSEQQDMLPKNPAGTCELTDTDLEAVQGSLGEAVGSNGMGNGVSCVVSFGATGFDNCNTFADLANKCGFNYY